MRVLFVNHTAHRSGAGISLGTLAKAMPQEIERFYVVPRRCGIMELLGAEEEKTFRDSLLCQFMTTMYTPQLSLPLRAWHLFKGALTFPRLKAVARRFKPDLVHLNETNLLAHAFAARRLGLPVVLHARTALAMGRPLETFLLKRIAGLGLVRIVCIDGEVLDSLPEPCKQIARVVFNPIDLGPEPDPADVRNVRASWGCGASDVVIGQAASLHTPKGIWLILDLAEKLCQNDRRLRFVLVGDDSKSAGEGPALREAIKRRGLDGKVILPGLSMKLAETYAAFDIALCLFGGGLGGVGRAAYEAALAKKPLVATLPDPANSKTLRHGESALLFTQKDVSGIAGAIKWLAANPMEGKALGRRAHAAIAARHDPKRVAQAIIGIYKDLLAENPGGC